MWHVETDFFALAVFLIMFIKEYGLRKEQKLTQRAGEAPQDIRSDAFYLVLVFSMISALIDIISSVAMNDAKNWWFYEISMTIYVISMPLLAAIWVGYAYVLIHQDATPQKLQKGISVMLIPYLLYACLALSNPFTNLFFKLSKTMEYERGILFMPVGVGSIMLYSGMGLLLVFVYWKQITPRFHAMLLMTFFAITAAFTWVQLAHPGWLIINASYAVIYVWCDVAIEDECRRALYQEISRKNEELKVTADKAEAAAHAKTEFLSRMSHDIRTPMNAIIGLTHLAKSEENIQTIRDDLNKIDSSSKFLLGLINDILDLSKIENGEMTLHEGPFTREEFQDSIQTVIKPLIDEKQINFVFDMRCGVDCIKVDRLRFSQIFFNLLSNAAKFTPTGGTIEFISERIHLEGETEGKVGMRMYVRDNGIGMSKEFQKHMYDPFLQERSELGDNVRGTGLGLPIVKSLVEAMNGTIEVTSELGKGTEFVIEMPVELAERPQKEQKVSTDKDGLKDMHILLVEDNELNIYVAKAILEQFDCVVYVANNGQEAVTKFAESTEAFYDIVLMDVHMPVMNGMEATKRIRELDRKDAGTVPIIAMTADAFDEEKKEILHAGMTCHLPKPIDPPLLYQTLLQYKKC